MPTLETLDILDTLDEFTKAYIEALLWAETDGDKPLDNDHSAYDLAPGAGAVYRRLRAIPAGQCRRPCPIR